MVPAWRPRPAAATPLSGRSGYEPARPAGSGHAPFLLDDSREISAGVAGPVCRQVLRRALRDDAAAAVAPFGAEVDDPVRGLDDVEVVLDHHHGVAGVAQAAQHVQQELDVVEVQAGGGLVQDVERAAGVALGKLE